MNIRHLSLTARMSLMFMSAVIAVLVIAGLSFYTLSKHHFEELDRQALVEKLESTRHILGKARDSANLAEELPQLRALLGAHQDLLAIILGGNGSVLFADSSATAIPESFRHADEQDMWSWQDGEQLYRGMTALVTAPGQAAPLTILLAEAATLSHLPAAAELIQSRFLDTVLGCLVGLVGGICLHNHHFRAALGPLLRRGLPSRPAQRDV